MSATEMTTYQAQSPMVRQAQRWLKDYQDAIGRRLPGGQDAERYTALIMSEVQRTPKLLECFATAKGQASMMTAVLSMAQVGLEPGPLGLCYLLPFRNNKEGFTSCVYLLGYKGMIQLAYRSDQIKDIEAVPVYADDRFEWRRGLHKDIIHEPVYEGAPDYERLTHVYAIARTVRGGTPFVVLSKAQVEYYRARSRAKSDGPWVTDPVPMSCKTGIRRLVPELPLRVQDASLIAADEARDEGRDLIIDGDSSEVESENGTTRRRRAQQAITQPPEPDVQLDNDAIDRALREQDGGQS